ncbi:MAG: hypothetical protein WAX69_03295 [Victivallales bacterium]
MDQDTKEGLQGNSPEGVAPSNVNNLVATTAQEVLPPKRKRGRPRKIRPEIAQPQQIVAQDCGKSEKVEQS